MKARIFKCLAALVLVLSMVAGCTLSISAAKDMAYNIYSNPVVNLPDDQKMYDTFQIDFRATQTPTYTYWALSNFSLYISEISKNKYPNIRGGGGYAGLQDKSPSYGNSAIMAFWEWQYNTNDIMRANRVYPYGAESNFGGEGEGNNWITPFDWKDNQWYRMVLRTWTDRETGTTFAGQWFLDVESGEWTLISYFNTNLINSCWTGNMSFFMENFVGVTADEERDMQLKNIYMRLNSNQQWISAASTELSHCGNWANNKTGAHSFGATEEYFWGKAGGLVPEGKTQSEHDKEWKTTVYTINQAATPTIANSAIGEFTMEETDGNLSVSWAMAEGSNPQLSYSLSVKNEKGEILFSKKQTRPEITSAEFEGIKTDAYMCEIKVTDIYGNEAIKTISTEKYKELTKVDETPDTTDDQTDVKKDSSVNVMVVSGIAAGAVLLLGAVIGGVVVVLKKKQ